MPQLHLSRLYPGPSLLPEHTAERAVGVGESIDHTFGVVSTVADPVTGLQPGPYVPVHGLIHPFIEMWSADVFATCIQRGANQHMLPVASERKSQPLSVVPDGKTLQAGGGVETPDNFDAAVHDLGNGAGQLSALANGATLSNRAGSV